MYCTSCGSQNSNTGRFCANCGQAATAVAPFYSPNLSTSDFRSHFRILGLLWIAESALRLVPGLILLTLFGLGGAVLSQWIPFGLAGVALVWMPILVGIGALLSISAIAGIFAGWGLLNRRPWARTLALILGLVSLPNIPFGTALGVYTLWVLLPGEAEKAYEEDAAVVGPVSGFAL
jgi:hypothetical protein